MRSRGQRRADQGWDSHRCTSMPPISLNAPSCRHRTPDCYRQPRPDRSGLGDRRRTRCCMRPRRPGSTLAAGAPDVNRGGRSCFERMAARGQIGLAKRFCRNLGLRPVGQHHGLNVSCCRGRRTPWRQAAASAARRLSAAAARPSAAAPCPARAFAGARSGESPRRTRPARRTRAPPQGPSAAAARAAPAPRRWRSGCS